MIIAKETYKVSFPIIITSYFSFTYTTTLLKDVKIHFWKFPTCSSIFVIEPIEATTNRLTMDCIGYFTSASNQLIRILILFPKWF